MATLREVAEAAGVSKMTVSNVLNGKTGKVSKETLDNVLQVVEEMGYVRNSAARSLSANTSHIVTIVYGESAPGISLGSEHDALLIGAMEKYLTAAGKHVMIRSEAISSEAAPVLRSWNSEGAIFLSALAHETAVLRAAHDVPMVFVDNFPAPDIDTVGIDDREAGYLAGRCLVDAGHTKIAFVGPSFKYDGVVKRRFEGIQQALSEVDGGEITRIYDCDTELDLAIHAAEELARDRNSFTGVAASADVIAIGLIKGLTQAGLSIPKHMSVVGFDDIPAARIVSPTLTTVRQNIQEKAAAAARLLLSRLNSGSGETGTHVPLDIELMARESVTTPPQL